MLEFLFYAAGALALLGLAAWAFAGRIRREGLTRRNLGSFLKGVLQALMG